MLFNSVAFALFFPLVTVLYFWLPHRARWALLLAASCGFYMWFRPDYILILGFTIVVDYWAGLWIAGSQGARRRFALGISLAANVAVLAVFKYWNFAHTNLEALAAALGWKYPVPLLEIILPIGLSFHTFQAMSYTIEVYRGAQPPERHFGIYALYVMFYPQLVAGPIERPQNLLHQFHERHHFDRRRALSGLRLMAWGLFKKVCIADRMATVVNPVYSDPGAFTGPWLAAATAAFAAQIFCDFSGYSDIAIGSARVMGFSLMKNFDQPYRSRTIAEFWRRWHISLSTWFRDYVYVPLGGNRVDPFRRGCNLLAVFLLSGLWHGASWNFVVWGGLHGLFLIGGMTTGAWRTGFRDAVARRIGTTIVEAWQTAWVVLLVCLGWVFFRAATLPDALAILRGLPSGWSVLARPSELWPVLWTLGWGRLDLAISLALVAVVAAVHALERRGPVQPWLDALPAWQRWTVYYGIVGACMFLGATEGDQFIYFQF